MSKFIRVTLESNSEVITINADQIVFMDKGEYGETKLNMIGGQSFTILESKEQIEVQLLRDEFAMAALTGILANSSIDNLEAKDVAHDSYVFANAMLKERLK